MGTDLVAVDCTILGEAHRIVVCPRVQASSLEGPFDCILMTGPDSDPIEVPAGAARHLELLFDDVEDGEHASWGRPLEPMGKDQAMAVADFVWDGALAMDLAGLVVVACDGGVSRSAGVAAGVLAATGNDDSEIFRRKCPNSTCRRLVMEAMAERLEDDWNLRTMVSEAMGTVSLPEGEFEELCGLLD
ncbi:hypothetical protein E5335_07760 [Coriobacteriaceae bacterium]|nr:hypothetical protein E5335_07760 [Coriobacteriaceae bacterium]